MRILIVDDHVLFRSSLRRLLESYDSIEVVGEAGTGSEGIELARDLLPQVVLMDLKMPGLSGIEATRHLTAELPDVKVVMLTGSEQEGDLFEAIKSGARGFLLKTLEPDEFVTLLQGVMKGGPALTPELAQRLLEEFARLRTPSAEREPNALTEREREVLELMVDGIATNRKLAGRLGVSVNTVRFHVANIYDKLQLNNRAEVVAYAMRHEIP